jgi:hypothetical protein
MQPLLHLDEALGPYRLRARLYYGQGILLNLLWCPQRQWAFFWLSDAPSSVDYDPNDAPPLDPARTFSLADGLDTIADIAAHRDDASYHQRVRDVVSR